MSQRQKNLKQWQPVALPGPVTLDGRWATLEPLSAARHAAALFRAVSVDDSVWAFLADGPYANEAELAKGLLAKEKGKGAQFFAILPKDAKGEAGEAAGYASLMRMDAPNGVIEVGNILFSPSLQRTRAATDAMFLLAQYVFEELGYRRYEWKCNARNQPSRKAAERLGFTFEGIFRQHMVVKGENRDTAWYAMLDGEWTGRKQAFEAWLAAKNFDAEGRQIRPLIRMGGR